MSQVDPSSPCADTLYVRLKSKGLDHLSDREYQYFLQKDAACTQYQQLQMTIRPAEQANKTFDAWLKWEMAGAVVALLLGLIYLASYSYY